MNCTLKLPKIVKIIIIVVCILTKKNFIISTQILFKFKTKTKTKINNNNNLIQKKAFNYKTIHNINCNKKVPMSKIN